MSDEEVVAIVTHAIDHSTFEADQPLFLARDVVAALRAEGCEVVRWRPEAEAEAVYEDRLVALKDGGFDIAFKKGPDHWDDGDFYDHLKGVTHFAILRGPEVKP